MFSDLFEKIVPIPVYEAMNVFEGRRSQLTNMEIGRCREMTNFLNRCAMVYVICFTWIFMLYVDSVTPKQPEYQHSLTWEQNCSFINNCDTIWLNSGQCRFRSDCAGSRADLELHCPHIFEIHMLPEVTQTSECNVGCLLCPRRWHSNSKLMSLKLSGVLHTKYCTLQVFEHFQQHDWVQPGTIAPS